MKTELENIDRIQPVIETNDAAFERVSSDIKMEDIEDGGYLKQNTAGLVDEIPNISFLDIGDTFLETKKTFAGKEDYALVVGSKGKSVEAKPRVQSDWNQNDSTKPDYIKNKPSSQLNQEILWLGRETNILLEPDDEAEIPLTVIGSYGNPTAFSFYNGGVKILKTGLYRINFSWGVETDRSTSTWFRIGIYDNGFGWTGGLQDQIDNHGSIVKGGHSMITNYAAGDTINLRIRTDAADALIYAGDTNLQIELVRAF